MRHCMHHLSITIIMIFRSIPTEPNHYAGEDGNIYINDGLGFLMCHHWKNGTSGYIHARIHDGKANKQVHRIVCAAFNGLPEDVGHGIRLEDSNYQCHHINSIKTDNRPSNLMWIRPDVHKVVTATVNEYRTMFQVTDIRDNHTFHHSFTLNQLVTVVNTPQPMLGTIFGGRTPHKIIYNRQDIMRAAQTGKPIAGVYKVKLIIGKTGLEADPAPLFDI